MAVYRSDANLVSLWLFEDSGNLGKDYKNANNLTNTGVDFSTDAMQGGGSGDFERSQSDRLSITDASQSGLDITGSHSIGCWFKPESTGMTQKLVTKYLTTGNQRSYQIGPSTTNSIDVILSSAGTATDGVAVTPNDVISAGVWVHIAYVYNGTDIRIYIDGSLASNGASNPATYSSGVFNGTAEFRIGGQDGSTSWADGLIDEVFVFNRALSADEIADIYNNGLVELATLGGAVTPAGALARQTQRGLSGVVSPAGALLNQVQKLLAGVMTPAGELLKEVVKSLGGTITPTGALSTTKVVLRSLAGAITPEGTLSRQAGKVLAGAMTPAGALLNQFQKLLAGSISPAGGLLGQVNKSLSGATTPAGVLVYQASKLVSGMVTPTGALQKMAQKEAFGGAITPTGALDAIKIILLSVAGAITPQGTITRQAQKVLAGVVTSSGALAQVISKLLAGTITPMGNVGRLIPLMLSGALTPTGSVATAIVAAATAFVTLTLRARDFTLTLVERTTSLTLRRRS